VDDLPGMATARDGVERARRGCGIAGQSRKLAGLQAKFPIIRYIGFRFCSSNSRVNGGAPMATGRWIRVGTSSLLKPPNLLLIIFSRVDLMTIN
jgi:hypothetical protein